MSGLSRRLENAVLIVKPYGRSYVEREAAGGLRRAVRRTDDLDTPVDMAEFAATHPELVIAQWVSVIDRVATKPRPGQKPTKEQRALRDKLGTAAWKIVEKDIASGERAGELKRLWRRKIHPYGKKVDDGERPRDPRGRWFEAFAGKVEPDRVDADRVAARIREHLFERQRRRGGESGAKREGLIAARAESIARNAPCDSGAPGGDATPWTDADKERYKAAGNIAGEIAREAENRKGRLFPRDVAPILYRRFGELFGDGHGGVPTVAQARESEPGLFALHMAIKDAYARLSKGRRKADLARILPRDMEALMDLAEARRRNRELAALVRLGKVIHYTGAPSGEGDGADAPANAIDRWPAPATVAKSRYWTSDGQSEIKRNEAFVRVWRGILALAAQTAADWADPHGKVGRDILSKRKRVTGPGFDADAYRNKLPLLFGDRDDLFANGDDGFGKSVLSPALEGLATLRNSSFHFVGRRGFARALQEIGGCGGDDAREAARELWRRDEDGLAERLRDEMRGAHFDRCLTPEQCRSVFDAAWTTSPDRPPLPRFRRVLSRAEDAWREKKWILRLPAPGNRSALEDPATLCRYTALKLLFERAFPAWLARRPAADVNRWLDRAVERATEAAREINRDGEAVSRAAGLPRLRDGETIDVFLDRLAAATATEFRVQRGYDPNPEGARKQSKYIDDIRCDTVAQAFEHYLEAAGFPWLLKEVAPPSEEPRFALDAPAPPGAETPPVEDWQAVLYFLAHLSPVEDIGKLRHQLRKLAVLEGPSPQVAAVGRALDLYIDMHDAKFDGGRQVAGARALKELFEPPEVFERVCPEGPEGEAERYVPWRGLREILRFGGLSPLMPVFERCPVRAAEVEAVEKAETDGEGGGESPIAAAQKRREALHEKWAKKKKQFSKRDREAYRKALDDVSRHRRLAAHVRLRNHARLHRLLMQVLGRLVDYAGLWERDLYFTTLALIARKRTTPRAAFGEKGVGLLRNGRIVEALRRLQNQAEGSDILRDLKRFFGERFLDGKDGQANIRNGLMHFNMLRSGRAVNLTDAVNDTRRLVAYDRKLKNAVSKSIIELMARENLDLTWEMTDHRLGGATVATRSATHLGDKRITGEKRITEDLHGEQFVAMAASLFGGEPSDRRSRGPSGGREGRRANRTEAGTRRANGRKG